MSDSTLHASSRYEVKRIDRKTINTASYNPRKISTQARDRLKHLIKTNGLVQPLIVNSRTMNLVGGHQRLAILDELNGGVDYSLDVALIDVTPRREMELNVSLNSTHAMGEFDENKLNLVLNDLRSCGGVDSSALALDLDFTSLAKKTAKNKKDTGGEDTGTPRLTSDAIELRIRFDSPAQLAAAVEELGLPASGVCARDFFNALEVEIEALKSS